MLTLTLHLVLMLAVPADLPYPNRAETEHFVFAWPDGAIEEEGIAYGKKQAATFFTSIRGMLGDPPMETIVVLLHGPAEGSGGYPRVDGSGRIHLYQYGPTYHGYFGALPHEMVHVFRIDRKPHHDWFFEEGYAELVALRVGKSDQSFPWYGTPVAVAVGQWLARGEAIPLSLLRENHRELNMKCKAQSYTLRSSFFVWLGDTHGDAAIHEMARLKNAGALEDYERFLGKPFDALAEEWRSWLEAAYRDNEGAEEIARRWREESPIRYMDVCEKGVQF